MTHPNQDTLLYNLWLILRILDKIAVSERVLRYDVNEYLQLILIYIFSPQYLVCYIFIFDLSNMF